MSWTLKVRDKFQAAHFLREYKGKCEKVHGHTFQVEVEIEVGGARPDRASASISPRSRRRWPRSFRTTRSSTRSTPSTRRPRTCPATSIEELKKLFPVKAVTVWESEDASATYSEDR